MTKCSILTLCFLFISFATFAQDDYEGETGSTSEENQTIIPSEDGTTILYKSLSFSNPTEPTSDYKVVYDDGMFGVSSVSGGTTSDYCDCSFELKEVAKPSGFVFYETGNCISEKFESGTAGVYIKNEKGYTVIAYFNYGNITETRLLALTEEDLQEAVTTNMEELQGMIALLADWYNK